MQEVIAKDPSAILFICWEFQTPNIVWTQHEQCFLEAVKMIPLPWLGSAISAQIKLPEQPVKWVWPPQAPGEMFTQSSLLINRNITSDLQFNWSV